MKNVYINIFGNDTQDDIEISEDNLLLIENWNKNKATLFQIKSCVFQLALSFKDYTSFMNDYNSDKIVCNIPNTNENDYIAQHYNRYLLNLTSSYVACTEYYKKICEIYNLSSIYKSLTDECYAKFFEYRLFHKLRNFILHNAVPINIVKVTRKKLICTKDYLLEYGNWNKDLKKDIQTLQNEIELDLYIEKAKVVLLKMLDILTYNVFNKGLDLYDPLEHFLFSIDIKNMSENIVINIEDSTETMSMVYNFEKEYNFFKNIANNKSYASELFKLYINNS